MCSWRANKQFSLANQCVTRAPTGVSGKPAARQWRRCVKVALQAAPHKEIRGSWCRISAGEQERSSVASMQRSGIEGACQKFCLLFYLDQPPAAIERTATQSWVCCGAPRFHFVASRLRLLWPSSEPRHGHGGAAVALDSTSLHRGYACCGHRANRDTVMGVLRWPSIPLRCIEATLARASQRRANGVVA